MKKIEKQLYEFYEQYDVPVNIPDEEIPQLDEQTLQRLRNKVITNKKRKPRKAFNFVSRFVLPICCLLLVAILSIPVYNHFKAPTPPPIYYTDGEATKVYFTDDTEAREIINTKKSKYNFIFEDYNYVSSIGYYSPKTNELLSIFIKLEEKELPFTISLTFVFSNQFIVSDHNIYITDATYTNTDDYKLYRKEESYTHELFGFVEYNDFKLYINLNVIDDILFNKFL